ncbi:hypothetical protein M0811_10645 [Anaeramoeba ignava]|uniref:Uncharacterized protein n=1 Tax=Anaeramoeba ignava TaxID=1746090 RepID=A0A9Q0LED5_ANAIG|nr:hypothetical protein M0811_10645 [Anaeramoeba ignava]
MVNSIIFDDALNRTTQDEDGYTHEHLFNQWEMKMVQTPTSYSANERYLPFVFFFYFFFLMPALGWKDFPGKIPSIKQNKTKQI